MTAHSYYFVRALWISLLFAALMSLGACSTLSSLNPFKSSSAKSSTGEKPVPDRAGIDVNPGSTGGRATVVSDDTSRVTQFVSRLELGYVRIERIEDGAPPNDQPLAITATQLRTMLEKLEFSKDDSNEPIFSAEELTEISAPLSTALARAGPREDVTFAVSGKHGSSVAAAVFQSKTLTTGRLFVKNGAINIIFNEIHGEFEDRLRATGWLAPFVPGSRNKTASVVVVAAPGVGYASRNRRDWIQLAENTVPAAPSARNPAATGIAPGAATGSAPQGDAYYQDIEKRLTLLKGLKDKGLITEQEYNDKRKDILKGL
jgi:hypothetical protein